MFCDPKASWSGKNAAGGGATDPGGRSSFHQDSLDEKKRQQPSRRLEDDSVRVQGGGSGRSVNIKSTWEGAGSFSLKIGYPSIRPVAKKTRSVIVKKKKSIYVF